MEAKYKTTRIWPIPLFSCGGQHGQLHGLCIYRPSRGRGNYTRIRLVSVALSMVDIPELACAPKDANLEIIAGISDGHGDVPVGQFIGSAEIPRLDLFHRILAPHQVWIQGTRAPGGYRIPGYNAFYKGGENLPEIPVQWDRPIVGMLRYRRPLNICWRKPERPEMELYDEMACPCLWFRAYYDQVERPPPLAWTGSIVGTVVFEADR